MGRLPRYPSARLVALACALEGLFLALGRLGDLRAQVVEAIGLLLAAGAVYLASCYCILQHTNTSKSSHLRWRAGLVLLAALIFRLTVWPITPQLSDDPFRYRWEGKLQAARGNPYQARPADPAWAGLRDATWPRVAGKDFKAVYGPLIERAEYWTYAAVSVVVRDPVRQVFWFKLPAALCDLGVLAVLALWLAAAGLPPERVLIYAWCPLPIMEFWATGHNDALLLLALVLAFWAAERRRWTWAFAFLSLAAAAKLWPLLLFPLFLRERKWGSALVALPVFAVLAWPYRSNIVENVQLVTGFLGGWRNNDSLFGAILWACGDPFTAKRVSLGLIAAIAVGVSFWKTRREHAALVAIAAMLLLSANCHPWYLTWMLPLLAFEPVPALLLWTALVPLAYAVLIDWYALGQWTGSTPLRWLEYAPVLAMLAWWYRRFQVHRSLTLLLLLALPVGCADAWRPLFNGRNLEGWAVAAPRGAPDFAVENGQIRTRPGHGMLWYTREKLGNGTLRVVYKMTDEHGNSGIFIRIPSPPPDEGFAIHHGIEVQIDNRDDDWHCTGVLYSMTKAKARPYKPAGEWNTMEITLDGLRTIVRLNGVLVTDYDGVGPVPERTKPYEPERRPRPETGYIGLQHHDDRAVLYFKEISFKPK